MKSKVYTRDELDHMECGAPGCTVDHGPMYFHGACHPRGNTETYYEQGIVVVVCKVCKREVARVGVA